MTKDKKETSDTVDNLVGIRNKSLSSSSSKDVTALTYQRQSPTSVVLESQQSQRLHNVEEEDVITTTTIQTTEMSTDHSNNNSSSSSPSPTSRPTGVMVIATDLSNLTESSSSLDNDRMDHHVMDRYSWDVNSRTSSISPNDHLQSSMKRLHKLELKRNVLRNKQFNLEQRLYNFCTLSMSSVLYPPQNQRISMPALLLKENQEEVIFQKVTNWIYSTDANIPTEGMSEQSPVVPQQTLVYTGYLNSAGIPHDDNGILQFADGQVYEGSVRKGERHGSGTNTWPEGQTYNGEWNNNSRYGMGTHSWKDDRTVTGTWRDGHLHGRVYFKWPNGAVYDGNASNGKKRRTGDKHSIRWHHI